MTAPSLARKLPVFDRSLYALSILFPGSCHVVWESNSSTRSVGGGSTTSSSNAWWHKKAPAGGQQGREGRSRRHQPNVTRIKSVESGGSLEASSWYVSSSRT